MMTINDRIPFGFSAENPTGAKNGGTRGKDCEKLNPKIILKPGDTAVLCDTEGEGMITHIWTTGYVGSGFILRIYWDDNEFPSVEAPISAFFGCAYGDNPVDSNGNFPALNSSLLLVAPGRAYNSYFEMPFRKRAKITIENRSNGTYEFYYMISGWYGKLPENAGYFHAAYRQEHPVVKGRSYVVLDNVKGKGRFMGVTLASGMNGNNSCWVEGEAKMYIDGETYPSMNYTGTEDYFCGSYGFGNDIGFAFNNDHSYDKYQTYSGAYVGMYAILGDHESRYNSQKRFMLYRFHVVDEINFRESFKMTIDNLGWTGPRYDDYTTTAYYYLENPSRLPFELPPANETIMI